MRFIFLTILMLLTPACAFATVEQDASVLEADMDKVKPDLGDRATMDQQYALVERTRDLIDKTLAQKTVDDKAITLVARLLVRNFGYDSSNEVAEANHKWIAKYSARIEKAFKQLETDKAFTKEAIDNARTSIQVAAGVHQHGNDAGAPKTKQPKGKKQ